MTAGNYIPRKFRRAILGGDAHFIRKQLKALFYLRRRRLNTEFWIYVDEIRQGAYHRIQPFARLQAGDRRQNRMMIFDDAFEFFFRRIIRQFAAMREADNRRTVSEIKPLQTFP